MYKATDPEVIVDLIRLLPPSGDNRSVATLDGEGILNIDVFFDAQDHEGEDSVRLTFEDTVTVVASVAPGVDVTHLKCKGAGPIVGNVIEFRNSDAATAWMKALPWRTRRIRHFTLFLMEQGRSFHVFAAVCRVSSGRNQAKT